MERNKNLPQFNDSYLFSLRDFLVRYSSKVNSKFARPSEGKQTRMRELLGADYYYFTFPNSKKRKSSDLIFQLNRSKKLIFDYSLVKFSANGSSIIISEGKLKDEEDLSEVGKLIWVLDNSVYGEIISNFKEFKQKDLGSLVSKKR